MSLRKKTLLIVGITLISLIALLSFISRIVLLNSFAQLEQDQLHRNIERVKAAMAVQISQLDTIAGDWAPWDDTYTFMEDRNSQYIEGNLNSATLVNLGINFMLFVDLSDQVVYSKAVDLASQTEAPVSTSLLEHLKQKQLILHHSDSQSTISGIILLPEGPILFASRPILTSNFGGPSRGTLVVGRYLDEAAIQALAETTQVTITVQVVNTPPISNDFQLAQTTLNSSSSNFIQPLTPETLAGYLLFDDVYKQPAFLLRITIPRAIYQQGQVSVSFFITLLVITGLIFGLITLWLLERGVLARLTQLSYQVNRIGASGNMLDRVDVTGKDELTSLAAEINKMLTVLGQSQQALQESEEVLRQAHNQLEQKVEERTTELAQANHTLQTEVNQRKQVEQRLAQINDCFLSLGQDYTDNINRLTALCGELLGATAALYNRLDQNLLCSIGQWHTPPDYNPVDKPDGHICYDVITQGKDGVWVINHLSETIYARTDPNVAPYHLQTYMGKAVKRNNKYIGSLCVVFQADFIPSDEDKRLLSILASAISTEEERQQAANSLAQARDQALAASQLKSELLAKVSHELRTPLGVIMGFAEMLEMGVYGSLSSEQKNIMTEIIDSSVFLNTLVNELLNQAQLDAGRLKLNIDSFTPSNLIEEMLVKMKVLAQAKGLTLTTEIAPDLPSQLTGDLTRLQQILINLVNNAIKFTTQGTVTVRLLQPDAQHWAMQVVDTGIGIPVDAQTYIFEPFRQVDGSITRAYEGSGLGLSIVKQLTELMGGQITLQSQIGQGSTFTVFLPLL